jgi:23S rRNA (adenine2030-N6)-methyltransferase
MNYRHAYHAGNFADVLKHVVLSRILVYLQRKEAALRVIDTHAGTGLYDLSSEEAQKTGEWRDGIGRLLAAELPRDVAELLAPYLDAVRAVNGSDDFSFYPGSPMIARHLLRRQDRLTAIELHPKDALALKERFAGDHQARIIELDGWLAMGAHVPPK